MTKIRISLKTSIDNSYNVILGNNLDVIKLIKSLGQFENYVLITDNTVQKIHNKFLQEIKRQIPKKVIVFSFPSGEKNKIQKTKTLLEEKMLSAGCGRKTLVIAFGGGVVGDMAGFVAATFMRGVPWINIPTTLLSMADSSIGGKVGIDTAQGKNLIGAFWQPKMVLIDLNFLQTLPIAHLKNGLVEIIKMAITSDEKLFKFLDHNLNKILKKDKKILQKIIFRGLQIKANIVEKDEKETGKRMILNFGHTVGHSIEKLSKFKILHGFGVALGILVESKISLISGVLSQSDYIKISNFLNRLGVNFKIIKNYSAKQILFAAKNDKKSLAGKIRIVIIKKIGQAENEIRVIENSMFHAAL